MLDRPSLRYNELNWGIMRILIDGDGNIIEGDAELMTVIQPRPDGPVHGRVFRCPQCDSLIDAAPNETTKHEC